MRLTLVNRIGPDTLSKLEKAARRRFAEATCLAATEPLGSIYLFGYTVEMRLKAAYFRVTGSKDTDLLDRKLAEGQIRNLLGINKGPVGHNLYGWATLLEATRGATPGTTPLPHGLAQEMYAHVMNIQTCWTEVLRYRANKPYDKELRMVQSGATWFKSNSRRLWS